MCAYTGETRKNRISSKSSFISVLKRWN